MAARAAVDGAKVQIGAELLCKGAKVGAAEPRGDTGVRGHGDRGRS